MINIKNHIKGLGIIAILALDRKLLYKLQYYHQRRRFPNLKHPRDLSERILSEMLKPSFAELYADYADKIKVRQYVKNKGLEGILLKHYGVWDDANKIDFEILPDKFVLKTNNGCGGYVFCRNKSALDIRKAIKQINKTLHLSYYFNKEPHYKAINPLIFCEELIDTGSNDFPADYKFVCIKGKPFSIVVYTERGIHKRTCMFDLNWNLQNMVIKQRIPKSIPEKPKNLVQMIEIAKILSEGFDFVRVDMYNHDNNIRFGELTFTPSGGLFRSYTDEAIKIMGSLFDN